MAQAFPPLKPKVILGVAAHPDDLEFSAAGTVAKLIAEGATGYFFILTNANKGSADRNMLPDQVRDQRREEQRQAAKVLGLTDVFFGDYEDGMLECTLDLKRDVARIIRTVKPDVVFTMDPTFAYSAEHNFINHPDHRAAGQATLDAVYPLARDHLSFPELLAEGLEPHKVSTVLLTNFDSQNYRVDISNHLETKLKALAAHVSQLPDSEAALQMVRSRAEQTASKIGARYAESFIRLDPAR
jgi:LmbE family N-acetylglucosaminyl deacetylase